MHDKQTSLTHQAILHLRSIKNPIVAKEPGAEVKSESKKARVKAEKPKVDKVKALPAAAAETKK